MRVNILGTPYEIIRKTYEEEPVFGSSHIDGYQNGFTHKIVVCDMHTHPAWKDEDEATVQECHKQTLRHEIVHAFFDESGLAYSTLHYEGAWSKNEELVDWIALQGPKIYKAWEEAGAL